MALIDYVVLTLYLAGLFCVGLLFVRRNKNASDMFAAGGQSPWWTSGLSAFMTMFSANTFVVWGGIAYKLGMVAVVINLMYGVAALLVGYFVAGRWKALGIQTPAQFIQLRYGKGALHFYTSAMVIFRMVGTAGSLYALGIVFTGLLSSGQASQSLLNTVIVIFGVIVVLYTMLGGLWAVLMTDVLQFIVLNLAVLLVVPLSFMKIGGISAFIEQAPAGFFQPTAGSYTWIFLAGWCAIHFFMIGAEWAFVQRFICVPSVRDARKSTFLFGALYLISPLLWLLPPMLWRIQHPIPVGASDETIRQLAENAYILSCKNVLPAGLVGLMLAAMFSATASMVSSQLNVFSGVLTHDIWRPLCAGKMSDQQTLRAGRVFTLILGGVLIGIALAIPHLGGAEKVIVSITELMVVALLAPTLWGLFSRTLTSSAVWITAGVSFTAGVLVRFVWHVDSTPMKTFTGVVLPVLVLVILQQVSRGMAPGHQRVKDFCADIQPRPSSRSVGNLPARIVAWSIAACGLLILLPLLWERQSALILVSFALVLFVGAAGIGWCTRDNN
jgi:solute:Na+ symporter, SSS family